MPVTDLPDVAQIDGFLFSHPGGADPSDGRLRVQYTATSGQRFEVQLPALAAVKLLTLLEQWSHDQVLDHLRHAPGAMH